MFIKMRNIVTEKDKEKNPALTVGDWQFGNNLQDYGDNLVSTSNNIKTKLNSFKWDCFFDLNAGIDWFEILAKRGQYMQDLIEINVRLCILQSLYVTEIIDLKVIPNEDRSLNLEYTINTIFGTITDSTVVGGE